MAAALIAGLAAAPSAAHGAAQQTAPCAKLTAGEVKFPSADANRVVFVTAEDYGQADVLITGCLRASGGFSQEWQVQGFIGARGFAPVGTLGEGQFRSPTGSFSVTEALGLANPGTALTYHVVNPASRWGGPGSPSYNSYLEGGSPRDENLWFWANQGTYAQAAVINYNRPPDSAAVPGADYAIFFGAGNRPSAGCVSTTLDIATRAVQTLSPGDRFIMGVIDDVFAPATPAGAGPTPEPGSDENASDSPAAPPAAPPATASPGAGSGPPTAPGPSAPTPEETAALSAPASGESGFDFLPLGILLAAAGATALLVFLVLRAQE